MRKSNVAIYGSSYDRGLEHLLKIWPDVKKAVPEAELRIFYGWDLFDRVYGNNPERQAWKDKMNKLMQAEGITHLGRISHEACVKEHQTAGVWAYPTHFGEISCITAMRAQAYGSIPVVINYAALEETVQYGAKVNGDIYEPEVREEYKTALIKMLSSEETQIATRTPMVEWAKKKFAWSAVADQWTKEFKGGGSLERQVEALMDDNQALEAWEMVKDTSSPLKDRVWLKVRHAFDKDAYKKYYSEDLVENPLTEIEALNADRLNDRYKWIAKKLKETKPKTLVDLGCADGALCLTLAKDGIECTGVNLYKPSVDFANKRAEKNRLPAKFVNEDLFDHKGKYDAVVITEVIEHLPDPAEGIKKAVSLAKKGGRVYISTPRVDHLGVKLHKEEVGRKGWDDGQPAGHLRLLTEKEFKKVLKPYKVLDFKIDMEKCMLVEIEK